jgi:hypothetical protein
VQITIEDFKNVIEREPSLSHLGVNSLMSIQESSRVNIKDARQQLEKKRTDFLSNFGVVQNRVTLSCAPEGQPKIAQQFIAGRTRHEWPCPSSPSDKSLGYYQSPLRGLA